MSEPEAKSEPPKITQLETYFEAACRQPSDTNEHLRLLRQLAEICVQTGKTATREPTGGHVTELGMRWATGSTVAFLAAKPKQLVSWELEPLHVVHQNSLNLLRSVALESDGRAKPPGQTRWQPRTGDVLEVILEDTDMIFFDTYHTAKQLLAETFRHGQKARKYLAFHDTDTFGDTGEDGKSPGLRAAIRRFQNEYFPLWRKIIDVPYNNGLTVLQRESDFEKYPWRSFWTCGDGDPAHPGAPGEV